MVSKVYQVEETAIQFIASAGDALLTLTSLAAGAGRQGALYDFGVAARAREYAFRAYIKFSTAPVVGERVDVYWKSSDGTHPDNDDGTGDIAVSSINKLKNLTPIGSIVVDEAATGIEMVLHGEIDVIHRHGSPVFWNASADTLSATAADCGFTMVPVPMESQ